MNFKRIKVVIIGAIAIIASCKKPDSYSDIPAISFTSMTILKNPVNLKDSVARLVISFTDGDGDLGTQSNDGVPNNFIVNPFKKNNGTWIIDTTVGTLSGHLPYLTQNGSNKALKGDIQHDIGLPFSVTNDTLRYEIYIYDRAGNESNAVTTPEIAVTTN